MNRRLGVELLRSVSSSRTQVGRYYVEGNKDKATVFELRILKKYALEEFKGIVDGVDAFDRAINWAKENQ